MYAIRSYYGQRGRLAARVAQALATAPQDGRAKLLVTWRLLELRRRRLELLRDGDYSGLSASGARAAHVLAFARRHGRHVLVTIAGRLFAQLLRESYNFV